MRSLFVFVAFFAATPAYTETPLPKVRPAKIDHAIITNRVLDVLEQQFGTFNENANALARSAQQYCDGTLSDKELEDGFAKAWLAWAPLDAYQFGPIETEGAALRINFFPDKKDFVGRALKAHIARPEAEQRDPAVVGQQSAALQGLPALERLIYEDLPTCPSVIGISGNMAALSDRLYDGWFGSGGWAALAREASPDNPIYHSHTEFTRQIYTAIGFSILRMREHRLGRPLGTYERSFPKRAEAWRSGLTNEIIKAQLDGIREIVDLGFAGAVDNMNRAWIRNVVLNIDARIDAIGAPIADAVKDPATRIRVEGLITKLDYLQLQLDQDVGPGLGVETGFSAGDGD